MAGTFAGADETPLDWTTETPEWDDTPQETEGEEPAEPAPEVMEKANALFAEREAALRTSLSKYGLDLATDGTPVIRDPARFEQWTEPIVKAKAAPAPSPEPEPQPKQELWEMDEEKLGELVEKRAQKLLQPLLEKFQAQEALLGKRWQDDAVRNAPQALAEFAPEMAHITAHPEFEEKFRMAIAKLDPEYLENAQALAATALQTVAFMSKDKMPKQTVGSRADAARAQAARTAPGVQNWGQEYAGSPDREQPDAMDNLRLRFLRQFVDPNSDAAELRALEAQDDKGFNTITAYQAAIARAKRGRK